MHRRTPLAVNYPSRRATRRAFTLVELLVVISIMGMLLSVLSVVMVRMMSVEVQSRSQVSHLLSMNQLSDQFRKDVQQAIEVSAESIGEWPRLRVRFGEDLQAEYSAEPAAIVRTTQRRGEVIARERYRLPSKTAVEWIRTDTTGQSFVTMKLVRAYAQPIVVVSEVGRRNQAAQEEQP